MLSTRLRCHGCGQRSQWPRGVQEFQCNNCQTTNFYDSKGEITHPPVTVTNQQRQPAQAQKTFSTFSQPQSADAPVRADDIFCSRCLNNQRVYTEAVANYLPDEDHPDYQKYEDTLDEYKAKMEKEYPMVCKSCAIKVQEKIHRADYYGKTQQMNALAAAGRRRPSPVGQRDDWRKWGMRVLLRVLGLLVYASLFAQLLWHTSGILATYLSPRGVDEFDAPDLAAGVSFSDCTTQARMFQVDLACFQLFSSYILIALLVSTCMLWYNHGLKYWYHHTYRMETIHGQKEHFRIQVILLVARAFAWYKLSNPWVIADLTPYQLYAAHFFSIIFMVAGQWISETPIKAEKWRYKGKMMPRPDEVDVFSESAGPAMEQYDRKPSTTNPFKLLARNEKPFPIESLAPRPLSRDLSKGNPPPSPPDSYEEDDDAMDIDWQASRQPQLLSTYTNSSTQPVGWSGMRNEIFSIQDRTRHDDDRKRKEAEEKARLRYQPPVDPSPFRGRLPQAPMSLERRLRNPPTQVQFKMQPLSKQQNFMQQMRDSVEHGRNFGRSSGQAKGGADDPDGRGILDSDDDSSPVKNKRLEQLGDFTPAKNRTKGSLDLHDSGWRLPSDLSRSTGLEDLFAGKSFSINDAADRQVGEVERRPVPLPPLWLVGGILVGGLVVMAWNVGPLRRAVCYWLIRQLGLEDVQV